MKKFNHLGSVITNNRKYETEIQRHKDTFLKRRKWLKYQKMALKDIIALLCNILSSIWQWMQDNLFKEDEETWKDKNVFLPLNAQNTLNKICEQCGSFKKNWNTKKLVLTTWKRQLKILLTHHEERSHREFNFHYIYLGKWSEEKANTSLCEWMLEEEQTGLVKGLKLLRVIKEEKFLRIMIKTYNIRLVQK